MTSVLTLIGAVLAVIVGVCKYFYGRNQAEIKRKEEALNTIKEGINESDTSKITAGFSDINH